MKWIKLIFFIFLLVLNFKWISLAANEDFQNVVSTIKISVCGDGVIEGGEECEGDNLNGETCESLGYAGGTLTCDIACSFDTSGCIVPTPTATPVPTATATPASTPATVVTEPTTTTSTITPTPTPTPALPRFLRFFDIDGSGRIEVVELFSAVKRWVDEWKSFIKEDIAGEIELAEEFRNCDLNQDGRCDLVDLSILLYYVGR